MKAIKHVLFVLVALSLIAFSIAGCTSPQTTTPAATETPVVKNPIKIGVSDDLSGPASGAVLPMIEGVNARIKYLNEKEGGIDGHTVELITIDNKFDAALAADAWKRLSTLEKVPVVYGAAPIAMGPLYPDAAKKDKMVFVTASSNLKYMVMQSGHEGESWCFGLAGLYTDRFTAMTSYIIDEWKKMGKTFPINVGFAGLDTEDGRASAKAIKIACQKDPEHLKFTTDVYVKSSITDATTQVLALKDANTQAVLTYLTNQPWIIFVKDSQRLGFEPVLKGGHPTSISPDVNAALGKLNEGAFGYSEYILWDDPDAPMLNTIKELTTQLYPNKKSGFSELLWGWAAASVCVEGLKQAVSAVGYDKLSGEAVKAALESGKPIVTGVIGKGGQTPQKYSDWWHAGSKTIGAQVLKDGNIISGGFYTTPDLTDEQRNPEYWTK